jgi:hypothetical protein
MLEGKSRGFVKLLAGMDWRYVWAYHRIADREGRRAPQVSAQLAAVAKRSDWGERSPGRGRGLWEGSAWAEYGAWEKVGIKQPRNFFSPEKNLVQKLKAIVTDGRLAELRGDFASVFARDPQDVAALEQLGWSLDDLEYRGVVVVGWGIPKGVAWIGITDDVGLWDESPEERANALFHRAHRFAARPRTSLLSTPPSLSPWQARLGERKWCRAVAQNLIGTTPRMAHPTDVLILPRAEDVSAARLRQLRGKPFPFVVIDKATVAECASFFPWLWTPDGFVKPPGLGIGSWIDPFAIVQLAESEDYDAFLRAVIIKSIVSDRLQVFTHRDPVEQCYRAVFGNDCAYYHSVDRRGKIMPVHISPFVMRYHPKLKEILFAVTEWTLENDGEGTHEYLSSVWREVNDPYADHIRAISSAG